MEPPTVREVIRRLEHEGWEHVKTTSGHRRFAKGSRRVTVSGKLGDHIKPGTWGNIKGKLNGDELGREQSRPARDRGIR